MFEENPITIYDNDQVVLAKTFLTNNKYDMRLDTDCHVFQTLCGTNWDEFDFGLCGTGNGANRDAILNKGTKTFPVLVHANGKHNMDRVIAML